MSLEHCCGQRMKPFGHSGQAQREPESSPASIGNCVCHRDGLDSHVRGNDSRSGLSAPKLTATAKLPATSSFQ